MMILFISILFPFPDRTELNSSRGPSRQDNTTKTQLTTKRILGAVFWSYPFPYFFLSSVGAGEIPFLFHLRSSSELPYYLYITIISTSLVPCLELMYWQHQWSSLFPQITRLTWQGCWFETNKSGCQEVVQVRTPISSQRLKSEREARQERA